MCEYQVDEYAGVRVHRTSAYFEMSSEYWRRIYLREAVNGRVRAHRVENMSSRLNDMDGYFLTNQLRKLQRDSKIICEYSVPEGRSLT
jgi:hypothetical protein